MSNVTAADAIVGCFSTSGPDMQCTAAMRELEETRRKVRRILTFSLRFMHIDMLLLPATAKPDTIGMAASARRWLYVYADAARPIVDINT